MRKAFLDNIRWSVVLLVVLYHVCYLYNGVGVPGGIPGAESVPALDGALYAVYPWMMVLLFLTAGMSARYSLQRRTAGQFLRERTVKLLIPSTAGLCVVHWITGYLNIKMGGGLDYIPAFLVYPISALSGIGPLWFIQTLFLFSCVLALLKKLDRADRVWSACKRANLAVILLLFVVLWGASQIGNVPVLTMYRFGIYFAAFFIGYYVFSHEEVLNTVRSIRIPALIAALLGGAAYTAHYYGSDYTAPGCLQSIWTNLYLWIAVLAIVGCAREYFDRETALTRYMTSASFGLYILHYPVLLLICHGLHEYLSLPVLWNYIIPFVAGPALTVAAYEGIRRIPVIRFLVLGRRKQPPARSS